MERRLVPLVALRSLGSLDSLGSLLPLRSGGARRPGRPLPAHARHAAQAPRAPDVPGDRLKALVAVGELQIAERLLVAMRLHARVDDPVPNAKLSLTHRGSLRAVA